MSEAREVLNDIVSDRQSWTGDPVRNLRTGATFTAEIEEISDTELNTELGRDARETVLLHVQNDASAAAINLNDGVQFMALGVLTKFKVVRRKDNPVSPQVEFGCVKIVSGKDV